MKKIKISLKDPTSGARVRGKVTPEEAELLKSKSRVARLELKAGLVSPEQIRQRQAHLSPVTLGELATQKHARARVKTKKLYEKLFRLYLAELTPIRANDLTPERVWAWWDTLAGLAVRKKELSLRTRQKLLVLLKACVTWGRRRGLCITETEDWPKVDRNIEKTFDPRTRAAIATPEQLKAFLGAAISHDERWGTAVAAAVVVFIETGMRQAEAAALDLDEVEKAGEGYVLHIRKQLYRAEFGGGRQDTKTRIERDALIASPLGKAAVGLLIQRAHKLGSTRLFASRRTKDRLHPEVLEPQLIRSLWRKAGLPHPEKATTHSLRHSCVLLDLNQTGSVHHASAIVGHQNLKTTLGYLDAIKSGLLETKIMHDVEGDLLRLPAVKMATEAHHQPIHDEPHASLLENAEPAGQRIRRAGERARLEAKRGGATPAQARKKAQLARDAEAARIARATRMEAADVGR